MKASRSAFETADALHSVAIALVRRVRVEDRASALTGARLSALSVLVFGGPHTLGTLAAAEHVSLPTMTRTAAALVRLGFARRTRGETDRRYVLLEATTRGARAIDDGRKRRVAHLAHLLADLDRTDLATCDRTASILRTALSAEV